MMLQSMVRLNEGPCSTKLICQNLVASFHQNSELRTTTDHRSQQFFQGLYRENKHEQNYLCEWLRTLKLFNISDSLIFAVPDLLYSDQHRCATRLGSY
jgi:hypothetical protein